MTPKKKQKNEQARWNTGYLESPAAPREDLAKTGKRKIGFLAEHESPKPCAKPEDEGGLLCSFDEGGGVSFLEGTHNVLVLGGTGRGKTSSVILPALDRLLGAGFGGLVIDVKGNFTEQTRSLARLHDREEDILELGTSPSARRVNLLAGLDLTTIGRLLKSLTLHGVEHSGNNDWHEKGVNIATDAAQLLLYLAESEPCFTPRLSLLHALCTDYGLARSLFAYFKAHILDPARPDHSAFVRRVRDVHFHLFTTRPESFGKSSSEWERQMSWNLQRIREILARLSDDAALLRNFSAETRETDLDFARLVYQEKKVVVLRFGVGASEAGSLIARFIKERFYRDVYRNGLRMLRPGQHTFLVADEFQDIMDVNSESDLNDFSWFSKSREFRNINLVSAQSMASLHARATRRAAVTSLLSNCSTKLVLQFDDPETLAYLAAYPGLPVSAQNLSRGRALVLKYDLSDRSYSVSEQGLQNSHDSGQSRLPSIQPREDSLEVVATESFGDGGLPAEVLDKVLACDPAQRNETPGMREALRPWPRLSAFHDRYRALLAPDITADHLAIPPGWMALVETAMARIAALDVPVRIRGIGADGNVLHIDLGFSASPAWDAVSRAREKSRKTCMLCGKTVRRKKTSQDLGYKRPAGALCRACRGLPAAKAPDGGDHAVPGMRKD